MGSIQPKIDSKAIHIPLKNKLKRFKRGDIFWGLIMIAPTFLGLLVFSIWPIIQSLFLSFTKWGSFGSNEWVGVENYIRMFSDVEVGKAFKNTFIYTFLSVPISIGISIVVAVLLNQKIRGVGLYRLIFFLPYVTMPAATAMVWKWLYNGDYGIINYILSLFSIEGVRWLSDPRFAIFSLVIVAVWSSIGYNMVILLSGLQGISSTYYEAASIDGAGPIMKFFTITIPLLTPTIFFVSILSFISTLQLFELVFMMVGPNSPVIQDTQTVVYLFYEIGFVHGDKGYAAAIILILFVLIMLLTAIQFKMQKKWVHYQ